MLMVKQMVNMMTAPRCVEEEVVKFMQGDTVIFMHRLHRMGALQGHGGRRDQVEVGNHQADGEGGGGVRDDGQADGRDEDGARRYGGEGGEIHARRHSYLRDQAPQDGAVQDQGEQGDHVDGGGGGDERVGDGKGSRKPSRKPVNWRVPKKKGLIPDGMVQPRLSNFVVRFLNLGMVGGGNMNIIFGDSFEKTASCQIEYSGAKRKREIKGDRETGGQANKLSKYSFLPGKQTE